MQFDDCLFFHLTTAARCASRYWKQAVCDFGITGVQAMVLNVLHEQEGVSAASLGKKACLDSATLSGVLDRLERDRLLQRAPCSEDGRAIRVSLTPEGRELAARVHTRMEEANSTYSERLSTAELRQLQRLLTKLQ
ncbi:MarR family winged helix-turn-helix transcriptional regulator [Marinobacterium marinum]|uniref:MarR family transcriptional regulator n=1 Tax=Marinobacterium marinum TaxID=2756129 RepID=A0A7W1WYS7_9GAMM|nr:MarR family transcriptional regulator [Marinobacterium marinum]MBA4502696.1 MarR family transcriptional regulator [Marinobacterium marinum]